MIITLPFKKNANYFAKNWGKSKKIVIITSTPGLKLKEAFGSILCQCGATFFPDIQITDRQNVDILIVYRHKNEDIIFQPTYFP
jgi:ABC-type sugar transport system substrate-binding protein